MANEKPATYKLLVNGVPVKKRFGNRKAASAAFDKAVARCGKPNERIEMVSDHSRHGRTVLRRFICAMLLILLSTPAFAQMTNVETAQAAINLLPRKPVGGVVIVKDADIAPEILEKVRSMDAFYTKSGIYVRTDTEMFRRAKEQSFFRYALAAAIWHEMAHGDGADEPAAQRKEEEIWQSFVRDEKVERRAGLQYAQLMAGRR